MPDAYGLPNFSDMRKKLQIVAPEDIDETLNGEIEEVLDSVIAEFESPVSYEDTGERAGSWHPVAATRRFDGTGYSELRVDDLILPGVDTNGGVINPLVVKIYDTTLSDVGVKQARVGFGNDTLYFLNEAGVLSSGYIHQRFPRGTQNVVVTGTWGNVVPKDVYEALRCEACYRMLVEGFVGLNGVGEEVSIGDYSLNTSVGALNFKLTSPLTVFHDLFLKAIQRHKERADRNWRACGTAGA